MSRVLITGIAGFVGSHVAACAAAQGHDVAGIDLVPSADYLDAVVDLADDGAVRGALARFKPDIVIHLAGLLRSPEPRRMYEVHVQGTAVLLEGLLAEGLAPRVIVASSSAVYGDPGNAYPISEQSQLRPVTHYAASKAAQETVALRYRYAGLLSITVARAFNIIGPGQPATLATSAFAKQIVVGERSGTDRIRVGSLSAIRDFVDVRDVANAYVALGTTTTEGPVYNICSGIGVPISQCLEILTGLANRPLLVEPEDSLAQLHDVRFQVGDGALIRRETGWTPQVALERSLADLLDDWRRKMERND